MPLLQDLSWAHDVFDLSPRIEGGVAKERVLSPVQKTIKEGGKLDVTVAHVVAQAMKECKPAGARFITPHVFF